MARMMRSPSRRSARADRSCPTESPRAGKVTGAAGTVGLSARAPVLSGAAHHATATARAQRRAVRERACGLQGRLVQPVRMGGRTMNAKLEWNGAVCCEATALRAPGRLKVRFPDCLYAALLFAAHDRVDPFRSPGPGPHGGRVCQARHRARGGGARP